jgi:hypothetical protein
MYNTITQVPASGRGVIQIPTMEFPLWNFTWDISYIFGDNQPTSVNSAWQTLVNFLMAVQGGGATWLFLHPWDNIVGSYRVTGSVTSGPFAANEQLIQNVSDARAILVGTVTGSSPLILGALTGTADGTHTWVGQTSGAVYAPSAAPVLNTSQAIATGDGLTLAFSMIRTIVTAGAQDLVQNFVNPPAIYLTGVLQSSSTYAIDQYGTITFTTAPGAGVVISWIGQMYYRCRFLKDEWDDLEEFLYQIWSQKALNFRSVLL